MVLNPKIENPKKAFMILEGQIYPLDRKEISIGRSLENQLVIQHPTVSRMHAKLVSIDGIHFIEDQESRSGTFVNGVRVQQQALASGDIVALANYPMIYVEYSTGLQNNSWESTRPLDEETKE